MLSSHPKSLRCDIEKGFITCFATLTAACSFDVGVWLYSLVSSPFTYTYECLYVFIKKKRKKILHFVKTSHIGNVWYWEGVPYLLDTNGRMQFWCCLVSILSCFFPLPLYNLFLCVFNKKEKKNRTLSVVKSSHIGNVWYWERVYQLQGDTMYCMQFCSYLVSVFSFLIPRPLYNLFVWVFHKKRKEKKDNQCCQVVPHR